MPPELETRVASLSFIDNPTQRIRIAQLSLDPPKWVHLSWLIEIFDNCRTPQGWKDPDQMEQVSLTVLFGKHLRTATPYINLIRTHGVSALPQLLLPSPNLESRLISEPFRFQTVGEVKDLLSGAGKWDRDFYGRRHSVLGTKYPIDGRGQVPVADILTETLVSHESRLADYLANNPLHYASNMR